MFRVEGGLRFPHLTANVVRAVFRCVHRGRQGLGASVRLREDGRSRLVANGIVALRGDRAPGPGHLRDSRRARGQQAAGPRRSAATVGVRGVVARGFGRRAVKGARVRRNQIHDGVGLHGMGVCGTRAAEGPAQHQAPPGKAR